MAARIGFFMFLFALFQINNAWACRIIPTEKNAVKYLNKLVKNTPDIYWVEAISYSSEDEAFTFKVIETIRGVKKEALTISGQSTDTISNPQLQQLNKSDFKAHRDDRFWTDVTRGRTTLMPNCRLVPTFDIGEKYLVLFKTPFQTRSLEIVKTKNDRWYKYVYETFNPPKRKTPPPTN